jgi:hypothetical protein
MPGASVNWDATVPADGDSLGQGDDVIRSLKTSLQVGLGAEHNWPATSAADTGYHLRGSGRAFFAAQSLVSGVQPAAQGNGRIMIASDTSRFFGCGSDGTVLLGGGPTSLSLGTFPGTVPQRHYWVEEIGAEACALTQAITFPNSGFSGKPYVFISAESEEAVALPLTIVSLSAIGFTAVGSRCTVHYRSLGTRVL